MESVGLVHGSIFPSPPAPFKQMGIRRGASVAREDRTYAVEVASDSDATPTGQDTPVLWSGQ